MSTPSPYSLPPAGRREEAASQLAATMQLPSLQTTASASPRLGSSGLTFPTSQRHRQAKYASSSGGNSTGNLGAETPTSTTTGSSGGSVGIFGSSGSSGSYHLAPVLRDDGAMTGTAAAAVVAAAQSSGMGDDIKPASKSDRGGGVTGTDDSGAMAEGGVEEEGEKEEAVPGRPTRFPPVPSTPETDEMMDDRADSKTKESDSPDSLGEDIYCLEVLGWLPVSRYRTVLHPVFGGRGEVVTDCARFFFQCFSFGRAGSRGRNLSLCVMMLFCSACFCSVLVCQRSR